MSLDSGVGKGKAISALRRGLIGILGTGAPAVDRPGGSDGSDKFDLQKRQRLADFRTISAQHGHFLK